MDDFKTLMNTFGSPLKGAIDQGRFQFLYQLPIARFPYFFGNLIVVQIIRGLSHVALLAVVCYFIYRVTKSAKIGLLIFVLFFSWMQNSLGTYSLVTSYVFSFHLSLISIFLAFIIFEKYSMNPTAKGGFLIAALTFYGISAYESYLFFSCINSVY
ncbi:MAG: hypothetical protein NDI80_10505 [Flavobacteriaceae bacterium]|nr:hypothetical protein [Flavobacteriaceae bacterium]